MALMSATSPASALAAPLANRGVRRGGPLDGGLLRGGGSRGRSRRARWGGGRRGHGDREARFVVPGEAGRPAEQREHPAEAGGQELLRDLVDRRDDQVDEQPDGDNGGVEQGDQRQPDAHRPL